MLKAALPKALWGSHVSKPLCISCPPTHQERACRSCLEHNRGAQPPLTIFSSSCHKGMRGQGTTKGPCPSFGPSYLMLLFPTRQMGVSSHHPNRLQAVRTTKASSWVTVSQVSKPVSSSVCSAPARSPCGLLRLLSSYIPLPLGEASPGPG